MGNQLEKEYGIKEKPLKLPGSYNFLRFIHHPTEDLSLIVVKAPHRATPIPSTLILPIKELKQASSNDTLAICNRCLPLALVKPQSESEMKILMHKIIRASTELGRCFLYMGRIMLWCEEKRGICSVSPQQLEHGKFHPKSKVFISGMALINFLSCVYENEKLRGKQTRKDPVKSTGNSIKDKVREKLEKKVGISPNESLPQQIKLFFEPKDKKQFYELYYSMQNRLSKSSFWLNISEGLRSLLMNMISEDPQKRIDLDTILNIPYFMDSNQLRLYSTLTDSLQGFAPKEAKIFMTVLQTLVIEGLTIQQGLLTDYFAPVLCSMVSYNSNQGKDNDYLIPMALSILIEFDKPPIEVIHSGLRKASAKNWLVTKLVLQKKKRLLHLLTTQQFDEVMSRAIFNSFDSQMLIQSAIVCIPFAMGSVKLPNYRKQIELLLVSKVLSKPPLQAKESLLLHALKCMVFLVRQGLLTSYQKLQGLVYQPMQYSLQTNFHILYLYGLMIESLQPHELLTKMMPKLQLYLNQIDISDQLFVVAKRCVDRILERLYEQRKIDPHDMTELRKAEEYFDMAEDRLGEQSIEQTRTVLKRQIVKHEIEKLTWTLPLM